MSGQTPAAKRRDNVMGFAAAVAIIGLILTATSGQPGALLISGGALAVFAYAYLQPTD